VLPTEVCWFSFHKFEMGGGRADDLVVGSYPRVDVKAQRAFAVTLHAAIQVTLQYVEGLTTRNGELAPSWVAFLAKAANHNLETISGTRE
jgi:hypothetical protein